MYSKKKAFVRFSITAQKNKFSFKNFFSKSDQIRRKLWIWSNLLNKSLMENFIFCAVYVLKVSKFHKFWDFKLTAFRYYLHFIS